MTVDYQYDALNRLASVRYPTQYGNNAHTVDYQYDRAHNRTQATTTPVVENPETETTESTDSWSRTYTYNALDQLSTISSDGNPQTQVDYQYDANGNVMQKITTETTSDNRTPSTLNNGQTNNGVSAMFSGCCFSRLLSGGCFLRCGFFHCSFSRCSFLACDRLVV